MTYSFGGNGLGKGRIALYVVVLLIFVVAVASIASNKSDKSEGSSGYLLSKKEASDLATVPSSGKLAASSSSSINDVQNQLDKLKLDLGLFSSNLTSCYTATAEASNQFQNCNKDFTNCKADYLKLVTNNSAAEQACQTDKTTLNLKMSALLTSNSDLNRTLSSLTTEHDALKKQFNEVVTSAANNLCCKARVDNPKIRFYKLDTNKIVCSEDSGTSISC